MATGASGDGSSNNADIPRGLINRTGTPLGRGSRLPSVRGHRDLTLGGIQRKVFTPNLAAIKKQPSKDEASKPITPASGLASSIKQEGNKGRGRGKFERGRGRGRGRGQAEDRTIQLQSEFAYGPMGGGSSSGGSRGESDPTAVRAAMRVHKGAEEDKKLLDTLLRDDFVTDMSSGDPSMAPIRLPLKTNTVNMKNEIKPEIKEEVMDVDDVDASSTESKPNVIQFRNQNPSPPSTVRDILSMSTKSEKGGLLFFQFPDTLPGVPASAIADDASKSSTANTSKSNEDELSQRLGFCQLKDCNEGFMGKLRVRKSGRTELVLGDNVMEILPGIPINFHQELVSVRTDDNPGRMVVLGPVNHKLVVTPDYNNLISNVNKYL